MRRPDHWLVVLKDKDGHLVAAVKVDWEDVPSVSQWRWCLSDSGYAVRGRSIGKGRTQIVRMHRELLGCTPGDGRIVDHINGDRLDNRRANLRTLTLAQSAQNVSSRGGSSRYRGVSWNKAMGKWGAQVHLDGKCHRLGYFADEREAARVARAFRAEHMPFAVAR